MKILFTGFMPFGGETSNPSYDAVRLLPDVLAGAEVLRLELPTAFDKSARILLETLSRTKPDVVICVGQAGGRSCVTPEYVAINYRDARIPDNEGFRPRDERICPEGPDACFSTLPVRLIAERCRAAGIPAAVSCTAGTYVCNALMYTLLHTARQLYPAMTAGFIHVPYSAAQAAAKDVPPPSMSLPMIVEALRLAGETAIEAAK